MDCGTLLADRYRLDQPLGHGGMGQVWRGRDVELDRDVAIKVLLNPGADPTLLMRFRREAKIAASLHHPGITLVYHSGDHEGRFFIVMELLNGKDLGEILNECPTGLPLRRVLDLGSQAAEALAAAHERKIVHRDLKPANLFVLNDDRLKICDFGIARNIDATSILTIEGKIFGTPSYMSPEQWSGKPVDTRSDLYSFGCVLYAMLVGHPPFAGNDPIVLMHQHLDVHPAPLRALNQAISEPLEQLVLGLLAKDPTVRPAAATQVAETLKRIRATSWQEVGASKVYGGQQVSGRLPSTSLPQGPRESTYRANQSRTLPITLPHAGTPYTSAPQDSPESIAPASAMVRSDGGGREAIARSVARYAQDRENAAAKAWAVRLAERRRQRQVDQALAELYEIANEAIGELRSIIPEIAFHPHGQFFEICSPEARLIVNVREDDRNLLRPRNDPRFVVGDTFITNQYFLIGKRDPFALRNWQSINGSAGLGSANISYEPAGDDFCWEVYRFKSPSFISPEYYYGLSSATFRAQFYSKQGPYTPMRQFGHALASVKPLTASMMLALFREAVDLRVPEITPDVDQPYGWSVPPVHLFDRL